MVFVSEDREKGTEEGRGIHIPAILDYARLRHAILFCMVIDLSEIVLWRDNFLNSFFETA